VTEFTLGRTSNDKLHTPTSAPSSTFDFHILLLRVALEKHRGTLKEHERIMEYKRVKMGQGGAAKEQTDGTGFRARANPIQEKIT